MSAKPWLRGDLDATLWMPMLGNLGRREQCAGRKRSLGTEKSLRRLMQTRLVQRLAWRCLGWAKAEESF